MPAVLVGTALARRTHHIISPKALRLGVLMFAVVSGLFLILR